MSKIRAFIPNFITLMNLLSGCIAIYFVLVKGDFTGASWMIVIAGIFDLFDGLVARLLRVQSSIGADLDSLSDLVSFGVAPSFLLFEYVRGGELENSFFWALPAFSIALFAAYRLAKFNNDTRQSTSFIGLPVPANALFWIGFVAVLPQVECCFSTIVLMMGLYGLLLLMGWAMISEIHLQSFKVHFPITLKEDRERLFFALVLIVLGVVTCFLWGWGGVSVVIVAYFAGSLIMGKKKDK